ncbi:hypothetical protein GCWU000341_01653 [Oribacterium sp. oral taxon 078 str. F0262]|nr:hypothetical protein GCWU000341_01653 [Oribacterium sp. oral taxon 078 str. F0262]
MIFICIISLYSKRPGSCMIEYGKIMRKDSRRIDGNLLSC